MSHEIKYANCFFLLFSLFFLLFFFSFFFCNTKPANKGNIYVGKILEPEPPPILVFRAEMAVTENVNVA